MSRKLAWVLGLAIVLTFAFLVYWLVEEPGHGPKISQVTPGVPVLGDCEKAQFPFACYLDKAMAANDPALCYAAGMDKRANCLTAYAEIKATDVDCGKLQDPVFRIECQQAFQRIKDEMNAQKVQAPSLQSPTDTLDMDQAGLKVDKK